MRNRTREICTSGKDKADTVTERQPLWGFAPQHVELMSKDKDSRLATQPAAGTFRSRRTRPTCKDRSSGASISRFAAAGQPFWVCGSAAADGSAETAELLERLL